jgi:hypothetical protein
MKSMTRGSALLYLFLLVLWIPLGACRAGDTRVKLMDADTGREIFSAVLQEGEQVILTWKNSLFGLQVTEVFEARSGALFLTEVTYASPQGPAPPVVPPEDVEELYQTGGPFHARGLAKPFREVVYRVGEIGEPKMKIRDRLVDFKKEVGFGGRIVLTVKGTAHL